MVSTRPPAAPLPYALSAATQAHEGRPPSSSFFKRCACRDEDRNAVLSCVEPACIAETKETLYDAVTQA
jgi:hypothetical protein